MAAIQFSFKMCISTHLLLIFFYVDLHLLFFFHYQASILTFGHFLATIKQNELSQLHSLCCSAVLWLRPFYGVKLLKYRMLTTCATYFIA